MRGLRLHVIICICGIFFVTGLSHAGNLTGKTIRFCGDGTGWPPYTYTMAHRPDVVLGYDVDVVREILEPLGIEAEFFMPSWKQCLEHSEGGNIFHVALSSSFNEQRNRYFLYSDYYYETILHYFYAKAQFQTPPTVLMAADLHGYGRVCGRYSYNYEGTGVFKNDQLELIGKSFSALVTRTLSGYCSFFLGRPSVMLGFNLLGQNLFTDDEIAYYPVPGAKKDRFYMLVSRNYPYAQELHQILNDGIARLRASGRLDEILMHYYEQME